VLTPAGHWSSYPPHKHDRDDSPTETLLEKTYYHRISPRRGFGLQRVYSDDRSLDETLAFADRTTRKWREFARIRSWSRRSARPSCCSRGARTRSGSHVGRRPLPVAASGDALADLAKHRLVGANSFSKLTIHGRTVSTL
jgi:hypothetical protein